jgi:hypothetical protein
MKYTIVLALFISGIVHAAVPKITNKPDKILSGEGHKAGGVAGAGFTLLDIKTNVNRHAGLERLLIDVGDIEGRPRKGMPGYFQVELQNNSKRVVIDFAQMPASRIQAAKLKEKLKDSYFVQNAKVLSDPTDSTLSLILDLKKPAKLKVFQVPGSKTTSKVVLDLMS